MRDRILEEGTAVFDQMTGDRWPCIRLRLGMALVLFFFFELLIGRQLPELVPYLCLGLGSAALASAVQAIKEWKLAFHLTMIEDAIRASRRP